VSSLKKAKRLKPFTAWALVDDLDTYVSTVHLVRADAVEDREKHRELIDAKWRIVKVKVSPA